MEKGVKFDICDNTLESLHIDKSKIIDNVVSVQSGFAELARLQFVEHYAYLKP
jgi:intracellular sulfur oxidation DsrE/DsrF family protein